MKRRDFLKAFFASMISGAAVPGMVAAEVVKPSNGPPCRNIDDHIKDYLQKMRDFDKPYHTDVYLGTNDLLLLKTSVNRFKRLQRTVGHGNFHLLSFDGAVNIARDYSRIGAFAKMELDFLDKIFYDNPTAYGFFGEKPVKNLTDRIPRREVVKIHHTGNYLYKGLPLETYRQIKRELGNQVILTSGVRSVIKQFLLFLNKVCLNAGNLSLASRQLAPPGYSYHGISDFDVGQVGLGAENFTRQFTRTDVYRRLKDLGYLKLRYPIGNLLGVRFEPWHIKI